MLEVELWYLLYLACLTIKCLLGAVQQLKYSFRQAVAKQILTVQGELHKKGSGHCLHACTSEAFQTLGVHL